MDVKEALKIFALNHGDDALVLSHRITEWCGHGPELEEDIALSNVGLDLLGQAQSLLNYAGELGGEGKNADDLAYRRREREFTSLLLIEQPNGNYANTIARQFFYDTFHYYFLQGLKNSQDEFLKGFAEKSIKEVAYHLRHSSKWVIIFGDGTDESHQKIQEAVEQIWKYTGEMFEVSEAYSTLQKANILPNLDEVKSNYQTKISEVLAEAKLKIPEGTFMSTGGRNGIHTENLGYMLTEMQYLVRTYPDANWD